MHPSFKSNLSPPRASASSAMSRRSLILLLLPASCLAFSPTPPTPWSAAPCRRRPDETRWSPTPSSSSSTTAAADRASSPFMVPLGYGDGTGKTKLQNAVSDDQERRPRDEARTTPQLMRALWVLIADASKNMQRGDSVTVTFPEMEAKLSDPIYLGRVLAHLDACKDVCDSFGANTVLVPHSSVPGDARKVDGFTVKSYRNPNTAGTFFAGDSSEMTFAPDPFWDDDEEWDFGGADDDDSGSGGSLEDKAFEGLPAIDATVPDDDDVIVGATKRWVTRMMADLALCPFTIDADRSGIPFGPVRYAVDRVKSMEDAYAAYWGEVCRVDESGEKELSTTLQIMPGFCETSVELFEQWADTLTGTLEALQIEELMQLIFFHPQWTFRDGGERSGSGLAANYARRSPWPMVNLLRTKQVRTAQKGIPTGLVYQQNEKTLGKIGIRNLESMLRARDWTPVEGMKVDRRDMEALRVAQDLQVEGAVRDEDASFAHDSTPAANKVDRKQVDGGNMSKVILEALDIRLEKGKPWKTLNGAQTSAALMASDFLLEELRRIAKERPGGPVAGASEEEPPVSRPTGGYAAAYGFSPDEYDAEEDLRFQSGKELEDAEMSAIFGGGIPMTDPDNELPRGMDLWKNF